MIDPVRAKVIARYIKMYGHEPYLSDEEDVKEWVRMLNAHAAEQTMELHGRIEELLDVIELAKEQPTEHWCQHGTVCARIEGQP